MTKVRSSWSVRLSLSKLAYLYEPAFDKLSLTFKKNESERFAIRVISSLSKEDFKKYSGFDKLSLTT
jgi:hypothetical protein